MDSLVQWFTANLSGVISKEAIIFIISMIPILELRGGLLAASPPSPGITLDKTNETIYPRGSVQLTATVDVANGASREVTWKSSGQIYLLR